MPSARSKSKQRQTLKCHLFEGDVQWSVNPKVFLASCSPNTSHDLFAMQKPRDSLCVLFLARRSPLVFGGLTSSGAGHFYVRLGR